MTFAGIFLSAISQNKHPMDIHPPKQFLQNVSDAGTVPGFERSSQDRSIYKKYPALPLQKLFKTSRHTRQKIPIDSWSALSSVPGKAGFHL
jgi:hypothetical protein